MFDKKRIENAVREILIGIGENPDREGLLDTPSRVAKACEEIFGGYQQESKTHLDVTFESDNNNPVIMNGIEFYSMCEHHMLPFYGTVNIAYIPNGQVVGLSKLARLVEVYSKRLQIQEQLTSQIAIVLEQELGSSGVYVQVKGEHMCMSMRGVKNPAKTTTTYKTGKFIEDSNLLIETMQLMEK